MDDSRGTGSITVVDGIGLVFGLFGFAWSVVAVLVVAPKFAEMFADFGGELPAFTKLCLSPWFPFALGLMPLAVSGVGIATNAPRGSRVIFMAVAILLTLATPAVFLIGMYLPIFGISEAIR